MLSCVGKSLLRWPFDCKALARKRPALRRALLERPGLLEKRIAALEQIRKHYKIFLMSNSNVIHYDLYVRDLQLRFGYHEFDELFNKSYFSFAEHLEKPDPRFFELILDHEHLLPEETLFIDDTAVNIKVAKSLGIRTYHIGRDELVRNLFENGVLKDGVVG